MHEHVSQIAGTERERDGGRLLFGGGNIGAGVIGSYAGPYGSVGTLSTTYLGAGNDPGGVDMGGGAGGVSGLTKIVLHIAVFWIVSIAVLIGLHKLGFRFSIVVGG